ncbi:MAG TPA: hypothetical protein VHX19_05225 [Stellaceae bacterium]|nr:hypothetical protein [Stellaceae bacterium]
MPYDAPPRPELAFRIGVTGARELPIGSRDDLLRQVRDVLRLVRDEIVQGAATPAIGTAYGETAPVLRLVSPLAEGADRLVARAALDEGYALVVPMPFAQAEYEKDFAGGESVGEFRDLLARATSRLELDGGRGEDEAASYEAVGRLVVRNCDLLIALWDGRPGKGRGGTAETVRFAANGGPPIWWARPDAAVAPRWIADTADLSLSATQPGATAAALKDYLKLTMRPPEHSVPAPELLFERLGDLAEGRRGSPQSTYFAEQKLRRPWYWKAHAGLMRLASGKLPSAWVSPPPPAGPTALYWRGCYGPADARSGDYGARYRSVYTWVLLLGALALIAAAVSVAFHEVKAPAALIELALLLAIAGLVWANHARRWHPRWIEYRLLAELCRKQQALALLGWSLPLSTLDTLAPSAPAEGTTAAKSPTWVAWLFQAYVRAAPMAAGRYSGEALGAVRDRVLADLIQDQLHYHADRERQYRRAAHRFALWGEVLFFLVLVLICVKLALLMFFGADEVTIALGLLAVIFPALAAGLVGFRSYAELQALAEQSHYMIDRLARTKQRIERLAFDKPLVSQALGARIFEVAITMLQDIDGWARLFRVKIVEAA